MKVPITRGGAVPDSRRSRQIAKFKRDRVLDLFLRRGDFWEAIKEARQDCGHVARPSDTALLQGKHLFAVSFMNDLDWSARGEEFRKNLTERVAQLQNQVIPEPLRDGFLVQEWSDFLASCIVFDPPAGNLIEFAEYGGPTRVGSSGAAAPLIKVVTDPLDTMIARIVHLLKVVDIIENEIDKCHPEIGVKSIIKSILDDEKFARSLHSQLEKIPKRYYLDVREDTSLEDVKHGYRIIKELHDDQEDSSGAPARDTLLAVQCAVLYDWLNKPNPVDRRRRKWTYERLADRFGLKSDRAAKEYVHEGRKLLQTKPELEE